MAKTRAHISNTSRADTPAPQIHLPGEAGPMFLEGRLVLSLSFVDNENSMAAPYGLKAEPLERYRIWDECAADWHQCDLELKRYEGFDAVVHQGISNPVWVGALDTKKRIIAVPDLDAAGAAENSRHDLCWKRIA